MAEHMTPSRPGNSFIGLLLSLLVVVTILSAGCPLDEKPGQQDDLALADQAVQDRDIGDAEMYFERYLRKNPSGIQRWNVWQNLLSISLDIRQDKNTATEYLEIMLEEFFDDQNKRRQIQLQLAHLYNDMRAYDRAVTFWEALSIDEGTPDAMRADVYQDLSRAYLRRLEFTLSTDMLDLCLQLDVQPSIKVECLFARAETLMLTGELDQSEKTLREMLQTEGALPRQTVQAVFTLADVLEQLERYDEARQLFESVLESYPNSGVIEVRLASLRNKKNSKTPAGRTK